MMLTGAALDDIGAGAWIVALLGSAALLVVLAGAATVP